MSWRVLVIVALMIAEVAVLARAILRPNREPVSRLAWTIVIVVLPVIGMLIYLLVGEPRISLDRRIRGRKIDRELPRPAPDRRSERVIDRSPHLAPFAFARSVNGLGPTGGNSAGLAADANVAIEAMVEDVDAAAETVHLCTYIWLPDQNGLKMKQALIRAASRGVTVRVLADALGCRRFVRSAHWKELRASGVDAREALPVGGLLWTVTKGRVDLRNHRKLMIVDNRIAWCGSQNIADPEFRIKPRYAPWVDMMIRWCGPVALQCQFLFVSDWMGEDGEDLSDLLTVSPPVGPGDIIAQAFGTGPTVEYDAMPSCFSELLHSARDEVVVTTPYFVPDEQVLYALTSAARRGVRTILVVPKRNDSMIVAATCRSYYSALIGSGVEIFEYRPGLLHAKTMIVDLRAGLIGSANLDRRSFELNFENNILFLSHEFAQAIRAQQEEYIAQSDRITQADVGRFSPAARLAQNFLAMLGPIL